MRSRRGSTYEPPAATRSIAASSSSIEPGLQRVAARAGVEARRRAGRRRCRRCRGSRPSSGRRASSCARERRCRCRRAAGCRRSRRPARRARRGRAPAATLPAAPTTSMPAVPRAAPRAPRAGPRGRRRSPAWSQSARTYAYRRAVRKRPQRAAPCSTQAERRHRRRRAAIYRWRTDGEGHREAHPAALADLVPDGRAPAGHRAGDPPRRRGLQRHERGRVRAPLLRRPRRARVARHPADGRQAAPTASPSRRTTRCARRTSTSRRSRSPTPSSPRCRPRCRCSTASSPTPSRCASRCSRSRGAARARCSAPDQRAVALGITALRRRPRALAAPGEDRDGDLPPQDDHASTTTRWSATSSARARSTRTTCSSRAASSTSSAAPTSATRCASSACRASAARSPTRRRPSTTSSARTRLRPARVRQPRRVAVRRRRSRHRRGAGSPSASPGRSSATSAASARSRPRDDGVDRLRDRLRQRPPARVLGAAASASTRSVARPARAGRRGRRARRAARRAPRRGEPRARRAASRRARRADAEADATPTARGRARDRDPPRALRAPRHARVDPHRGRPRAASRSRAEDVCERLQISDAELREDINVLNVVNFGGGSYVLYAEVHRRRHDRGRPRALLRQLRPPGAAAARRGQGARRGDRPHRRAPARGRADVARARRSSPRSAQDPTRAGPADRARRRRRLRRSRASSREAIADAAAAAARVLQGQRGRVLRAHRRALRAHQRPRGLVRRRRSTRRKDDVRHFRLDRIKHAEVTRRDASSRAPRSTRPPTSTAGRGPARSTASRIARVWVSPERARWAREERRVAEELADGVGRRRAARSRAPTGSCARCSRRPATPPCSSPPTPARPCWAPSSGSRRRRRPAEAAPARLDG